MAEKIIIEWQGPGAHIVDGRAYPRAEGDRDVVTRRSVKGLLQCNKVKAVGTPDEIKQIGYKVESDRGDICDS